MKLNANSEKAISKFKYLDTFEISQNKDDGQMYLFLFPINARNFDYDTVSSGLLESVAEYSLSRKIREKYKNKSMHLSRTARSKFREYTQNNGELGELILFCFLEGHLGAPKILTKLEMKTSNNMYVNGSDGIHLHKVSTSYYQLIFCESKTYKSISDGLKDAFKSITEFKNNINKNGDKKSGIIFEKGLISSNIETEVFDEEDEKVLLALMYPEEKADKDLRIDDAFSIFLGFEIDIRSEQKKLTNEEFDAAIEKKVIDQINIYKSKIYNMIEDNELIGHSFYLYILPFTEIDKNRKKLLEEVLA